MSGLHARALLLTIVGLAASIVLNAQLPPAVPPPPPGLPASPCAAATLPAAAPFEVVSIKPNAGNSSGFSMSNRPDGAFTMVNGTLSMLISRGYAGYSEVIGLPDWASSMRLDVNAIVSRAGTPPTAEQRCAMTRAMLDERFKLQVHSETREVPAFDLVLARSDGRLGKSLTPSDVDCVAYAAEQRAKAEAARAAGEPPAARPALSMTGPLAPCSTRSQGTAAGSTFEGQMTIASLASMLRSRAGRPVVDKTGLSGYYNVRFEAANTAALSASSDTAATPGELPNIFTAVQEQLGLKLESSKTMVDVLIVDRVERPTEN
jgi:uncharacterized protein (TIGR03435 family)